MYDWMKLCDSFQSSRMRIERRDVVTAFMASLSLKKLIYHAVGLNCREASLWCVLIFIFIQVHIPLISLSFTHKTKPPFDTAAVTETGQPLIGSVKVWQFLCCDLEGDLLKYLVIWSLAEMSSLFFLWPKCYSQNVSVFLSWGALLSVS